VSPHAPRRYGIINARGCWTLFHRGMLRFFRFSWHSLGGPCVSSLLFLAVFALAGARNGMVAPDLPVIAFLAPGIVVFSLCITAFEGAAMPVLDDKLQGTIADLLAAPLSPLEMLAGYVVPACCQALISGALVLALTLAFVDYHPVSVALAVAMAICVALMFALIGVLAGLWADKWEHYGAAETFILLPLGFLSGSFFSTASLPESWRELMGLNPVFLAVNAFRYGLTGYSEATVLLAPLVLLALNLALAGLAWRLFARGYKIRP
jgi:ABC-2 type transport system permease protein